MCARPYIFADHSFEAVSTVKLLQYVIANLNLKEFFFFRYSPYQRTVAGFIGLWPVELDKL